MSESTAGRLFARNMRDFPRQLRTALAAEPLAQALHLARLEMYGGMPWWETLSHEQRQEYRHQAAVLIEQMKPAARVLGSRFNRFKERLEKA